MSHFSLENLVSDATKMDGAMQKVPLMRWQRKALESGVRSLSLSEGSSLNVMGLSPRKSKSATCRTPGSKTPKTPLSARFTPKTPGKTPGKSSKQGSKTPKKTPNTPHYNSQPDRFIPNRAAMDMDASHHMLLNSMNSENYNPNQDAQSAQQEYERKMSENLGTNGVPKDSKVLAFQQKAPQSKEADMSPCFTPVGILFPGPSIGYVNNCKVLYSSSGASVQKSAGTRQIPTHPERILDAPDLLDDYYLNLLSWSANNHLAVALGGAVFLWNASNGAIQELMQLEGAGDYVSSVAWIKEGNILAVGNSTGSTQLWDAAQQKLVRTMGGHSARVGSLAWNSYILSSGSRSGAIFHHDVRQAEHHVSTLTAHQQEVCGLAWSPDGRFLASGGNDNLVCVWNNNFTSEVTPLHQLTEHMAAVKALSWCPWQNSLLATGGGTSDRTIRLWNVSSGSCMKSVDTGSQVCAILWSKEYKELISGHGFSQNQLTIWKYPSMQKVIDLNSHTSRVLCLAMSPDGTTVASTAADETICIWNCFAVDKAKKTQTKPTRDTEKLGMLSKIRIR